ncbi:MAG: lytic murein transglycosylase [Alphaproteobacteria bacterium]
MTATAAHAASQSFPNWLEGVRAEARERGLKALTISSALDGLTPIPRVIELDRKQPEFTLTLQDYLSRVVNENRVKNGRRLLRENAPLLKEVTSKYKVQPRFVVALWGIETDFGRLTGGFKVVPALATLAHDGRRSAYFRKELFNALKIIDQGHIGADAMMGSWAGAMGQSQFMPSSFLNYAVDYNGDGRRDIWTTRADVFASAANYLASVGWRNDQTWGRLVKIPAGFDSSLIGLKQPRKRLSEWQALGVRRADGTDLPKRDLRASLVKPSKSDSRVYLVYDNYRAVLRWNRSDYFATAVGTLSDRISRP